MKLSPPTFKSIGYSHRNVVRCRCTDDSTRVCDWCAANGLTHVLSPHIDPAKASASLSGRKFAPVAFGTRGSAVLCAVSRDFVHVCADFTEAERIADELERSVVTLTLTPYSWGCGGTSPYSDRWWQRVHAAEIDARLGFGGLTESIKLWALDFHLLTGGAPNTGQTVEVIGFRKGECGDYKRPRLEVIAFIILSATPDRDALFIMEAIDDAAKPGPSVSKDALNIRSPFVELTTEEAEFFDRRYYFEHTPSHGFLHVPEEVVKALGLADKITPYSYRGPVWRLEEDVDAGTFLRALSAKLGKPIQQTYNDNVRSR